MSKPERSNLCYYFIKIVYKQLDIYHISPSLKYIGIRDAKSSSMDIQSQENSSEHQNMYYRIVYVLVQMSQPLLVYILTECQMS